MDKLYIIDAKQKIREWSISVEKDNENRVFIVRKYGQLDGKMIEKKKEIIKAKSKSTIEEQALFEAEKEWKDQIEKKKYSTNIPKISNSSQNLEKNPSLKSINEFKVMLAQTYKPDKGFPLVCFAQPKLDGVRAYFNKGQFKSRNHKEYYNMQHISSFFNKKEFDNIIFDGELYNHKMGFQELMTLVKPKQIDISNQKNEKKIKENQELLQKIQKTVEYHIFDCFFIDDKNMIFKDRYKYLLSIEKYFENTPVKIVKVKTINKTHEIDTLHDKFVKDGYEGIILRTPNSPYEFKRSKYLQKYKKFFDDEFEVIGFDKEIQNDIPLIVWKCKTKNGKEFNVRPKGTNEERAKYYEEAQKYIGKKLTVEYQELTDDGIPRFPVGKHFRNDI